MTRKQFLSLLATATLKAQSTGKPVNDDDHGMKMSGVNGATDHMMAAPAAAPMASPLQAVTTRSGGNLRHGTYLKETRLTPGVVAGGLRKLFTMRMAGDRLGMEAQPLFMPAVKLQNGSSRDLCICCTMANVVYAFDAGTGVQVWKRSLGKPINGTMAIDRWEINDHWGILSTGVLDNGMLYCLAWVSADGSVQKAKHIFFEVKLSNGAVGRSLQIPDGAMVRKQRAALTFTKVNGKRTVFVPWGTVLETSQGAHGFITAIDIDNWKIAAEWTATPTGTGSGIWMAGQGLSESGDFYLLTGNGTFGNGNFGESFLRLRYDNGNFSVVDWWSPWMDSQRPGAWDDMDLGAGAPIYIPEFGLMVGAGKDGILYVLDANAMGKTTTADFGNPQANYSKLKKPPLWFTFFPGFGVNAAPNNIGDLDRLFFGRTHHQHGSPIYWNQKLYCWGENSNLRAFSINSNGQVSFLARSEEVSSPFAPVPPGGMPGGMMCLSANGNTEGVLWACVPDEDANQKVSNGRVFAFDANDFSNALPDGDHKLKRIWMSDTYVYNKFNVPVVNGGRFYVPTYSGTVDVFGV
ncbi:MAG: hypothetical protein ABI833_17520 [Acidobacteriota bacterium]